MRRLTAEELDHWKSINTALYWHVLPSLNLETAQKLSDVRKVNSFFSGRLADGRALLRWARSFVDASAPELQKRLQRALAERRLSATGATRASLHSHAETLKQIWELIGSNNPDDPMSLRDYWRELVASLPTEPARTTLVDVRTWLANRVADLGEGSAKALLTFDDGMSSVMSYAQLVGLPAGAAAPTPALLFTSDTGELCCQLADPASDGQLLPLGASRQGGGGKQQDKQERQYLCPERFCASFACKPGLEGNPGDGCICKSTSTFPLEKIKKQGPRRFAQMSRTYHQAHPTVSSLQNIKLKLRRTTKPSGNGGGASASASSRPEAEHGSPARGSMAVISMHGLMGSDGTPEEFEQWLNEHDCNGPGLSMLQGGATDTEFEVTGDVIAPIDATATEPPNKATDADKATDALSVLQSAHAIAQADAAKAKEQQAALASELAEIRKELSALRASPGCRTDAQCAPSAGAAVHSAASTSPLPLSLMPSCNAVHAIGAGGASPQANVLGSPSPAYASPGPQHNTTASDFPYNTPPISLSRSEQRGSTPPSTAEYLASAVVNMEREQRLAKDKKKKTLRAQIGQLLGSSLGSVHSLIALLSALVPSKHWATIILSLQIVGPTAWPHVKAAVAQIGEAVASAVASRLQGWTRVLAHAVRERLTALMTGLTEYLKVATARALVATATASVANSAPTVSAVAPTDSPHAMCMVSTLNGTTEATSAPESDAPSLSAIHIDTRSPHQDDTGLLIADLRACVHALAKENDKSHWQTEDTRQALIAVAHHFGVLRLQSTSLNTLADSIILGVWHNSLPTSRAMNRSVRRYLRVMHELLEDIRQSQQLSTIDDVLRLLLPVQAVSVPSLDEQLTAHILHQMREPVGAELRVHAIVGATGDPHRPVMVRLSLSQGNMLLHVGGTAQDAPGAFDDDYITSLMAGVMDDASDLHLGLAHGDAGTHSSDKVKHDDCCPGVDGAHPSWMTFCNCSRHEWARPDDYDSAHELDRFYEYNLPEPEHIPMELDPEDNFHTFNDLDLGVFYVGRSVVPTELARLLLPLSVEDSLPTWSESQQETILASMQEVQATGSDSQFIPALCDDGASLKVSCTRSAEGALPGSFIPAQESFALGDANSQLKCLGSYEFVQERLGSDGSKELVLRRMKHTPNLHVPQVISEGTEVYDYGYAFTFTRAAGRIMTTAKGATIPLFMSKSGLEIGRAHV